MPQQTYDPGSKWMLEERGKSILWLAGARSVVSVKTKGGEVHQARKLPDGLLEVRFQGDAEPHLVLVEVATYPEERVVAQMTDGIDMVRMARKVLPDAFVLCLGPKGRYRVPEEGFLKSNLGWVTHRVTWKVIEMWTIPADDLLKEDDVGLVPLVPLCRTDDTPEVLLRRCREKIDRDGGERRENLLGVTQTFASMHYNQPHLLKILGGSKMFREMPLVKEIVAETSHEMQVRTTVYVLTDKFGPPGPKIEAALAEVKSIDAHLRLSAVAARCNDLATFERALADELPKPRPRSPRGKRKPDA